MKTGLFVQVKMGNRLVGKHGNLFAKGKIRGKKDFELLGKAVAGGVVELFGPAGTGDVWLPVFGQGVMCLREGRRAGVFTSFPLPWEPQSRCRR